MGVKDSEESSKAEGAEQGLGEQAFVYYDRPLGQTSSGAVEPAEGARPELADEADLQEGGEKWRMDRQKAKTAELERIAEDVRKKHNPDWK